MYAQGWEALREIRGPFYEDTYAEFMSIVRAAAAAPQVRQRLHASIAPTAAAAEPISRGLW